MNAPLGPCVLAIDQGTSSTKALAIDADGQVAGSAHQPVSQTHPSTGRVEQDPTEILASVEAAIDSVTTELAGRYQVTAVGISSQRESALVWSRDDGRPLGPMLGWQDRRTATAATERASTIGTDVRQISGLPLDPMFSALKLEWLLDELDPDRRRAANGDIAVGTVDSWLVTSLTGVHRIEAGNASRTQLLDVASAGWSEQLLEIFRIPHPCLPDVVRSDEPATIVGGPLAGVPITGVLGDSHAALFAHGVRSTGSVKATYGTGSSIMGVIDRLQSIHPGLAKTIAWQTDTIVHAGEGNILSTGATAVWLASLLGVEPGDVLDMAAVNEDANTIDLVPAFAGLGAPWWDADAVATLTGFDLGTSRGVLAKGCADSIVLQVEDVVAAFDQPARPVDTILVDGGPTQNDWLMQLQADLSQRHITRRSESGLSALGAGHLAGATVGLFDPDRPLGAAAESTTFSPRLGREAADRRRTQWQAAVNRARFGSEHGPDRSPTNQQTPEEGQP